MIWNLQDLRWTSKNLEDTSSSSRSETELQHVVPLDTKTPKKESPPEEPPKKEEKPKKKKAKKVEKKPKEPSKTPEEPVDDVVLSRARSKSVAIDIRGEENNEVGVISSRFKDTNHATQAAIFKKHKWYYMGPRWTVFRAVLAEFIATAFLVYLGPGSALTSGAVEELSGGRLVLISMTFGFAVASLVYASAHLSGGHLNPAVTVACIITQSIPILKGLLYIVAQVSGAVLGAALLYLSVPGPLHGNMASNAVAEGVTVGQAFLMEFILTFLLVYVVFSTGVDPQSNVPVGRQGNFAPLAIAWAVMLAHMVAIPITGCGINPARSFGTALVANFWRDHWIFWIAPLLGGMTASVVYQISFMGFKSFRPSF